MRTFIKNYVMPALLGVTLAGMFLYMLMDPSTCRYEEVC